MLYLYSRIQAKCHLLCWLEVSIVVEVLRVLDDSGHKELTNYALHILIQIVDVD